MASSSTSASTSFAHTDHCVFDVFINHHGKDCKINTTFATDLYNRLRHYDLRVFLDAAELQKGNDFPSEIVGAIREASMHIAVFSENYASSPWCLEELLFMLQSKKPILPVFYGVDPSAVRWIGPEKQGVYARALAELEKKKTFDTQTKQEKPRHPVEEWRQALSVAANMSGFELGKYNGEHLLIDAIVEKVLNTIKRPVNVAKYPIGLDHKVRDFEKEVSLQPQSRETRVIGIVGLGGVGKTTLANEIFNRQQSKYDRCCRLPDVRENALKDSQRRLLKDLARWDGEIGDIADGKSKILKYLPCDPPVLALLILDDVDNIEHLNALLVPLKDKVKSGSLILITSRSRDVLTSSGIANSSIYELKGLNSQHSQELFCLHAFDQPHPVARFEEIVGKFVCACGGLPLSLVVIGALLHGKDDLHFWEAQLSEISKKLPDDIQGRLKISYDGLNEEEKQMFLDTACFFIGEDSNTAVRIWDGSCWNGWLGLWKLENKGLVEVDSQNRIRMHDHLRDLGRDLAAKKEPECPPLRLWRLTDNPRDLLEQSPVRGISKLHGQYRSEWSDLRSIKELAEIPGSLLRFNMMKLQLLKTAGNCVQSIFSARPGLVSPELVWLCWYSCPFSSLPPWIPLKKLRVLEITGNELKTLWRDESQAPEELRELNINAPLSESPKFIGQMENLESIVLHQNQLVEEGDLKFFLDELCHLKSLKCLVLKNCLNMKSLPDSFGNLTTLEYIDLSGCRNLQRLPNSFGKLDNLKRIDLSECLNMKSLPDSFDNLTTLEYIDLSGCRNLQRLPDSLGKFDNLQLINLSECFSLKTFPRGRWERTKRPRIE